MKINTIIGALLALSALPVDARTAAGLSNEDTIECRTSADKGKDEPRFDFDSPFGGLPGLFKLKDDDLSFAGLGMTCTDSKAPFEFNPANSLDVLAINLLSPIRLGNGIWVDYGWGLEWKNLTLKGSQAMIKTPDGQIVLGDYPYASTPKLSRLRIFNVVFPVLLTYGKRDGLCINAGPILNLSPGSCINNKYVMNGEKRKDKYKQVYGNLASVDLLFRVHINKDMGFWVKYSPFTAMDSECWPEFRTVSFGISL